MDILDEPLPDGVKKILNLRNHFNKRIITIRQLFDYFLFSFALRVHIKEVNVAGVSSYEVWGDYIDPDYRKSPRLFESSNKLDMILLDYAIRTILSEISMSFGYPKRTEVNNNDVVFTSLLGRFDKYKLESFKKIVTLASSTKRLDFTFDNTTIQTKMGEYLVTYLEFMLGANIQSVPVVVLESPEPEIEIVDYDIVPPAPSLHHRTVDLNVPNPYTEEVLLLSSLDVAGRWGYTFLDSLINQIGEFPTISAEALRSYINQYGIHLSEYDLWLDNIRGERISNSASITNNYTVAIDPNF